MMNKYFALIFCLLPILVRAHYHKGYYYEPDDGFTVYKNWMGRLHGSTPLYKISVPGTHDSACHPEALTSINQIVQGWVKTQCLTFTEQLKYGIRAFDIRICNVDGVLRLCHGSFKTNQNFEHFISEVNSFLSENLSEFIFFRLKVENPRVGNISDREAFELVMNSTTNKIIKIPNFNVNVEQVRGKIILLSDNHEFHDFGFRYDHCAIQDYYDLRDFFALYDKWEQVKYHLRESSYSIFQNCKINYLSGSGTFVQPWFVSSGHQSPGTSIPRRSTGYTTFLNNDRFPNFPRVNCLNGNCTIVFEGTNVLTTNLINMGGVGFGRQGLGLVMSDFPGTGLIKSVIDMNFSLV